MFYLIIAHLEYVRDYYFKCKAAHDLCTCGHNIMSHDFTHDGYKETQRCKATDTIGLSRTCAFNCTKYEAI